MDATALSVKAGLFIDIDGEDVCGDVDKIISNDGRLLSMTGVSVDGCGILVKYNDEDGTSEGTSVSKIEGNNEY